MTSYLVTYHGGGMPDTEEGRQQAMADFGAWVGKTGDALTDPGAPLGPSMTRARPGSRWRRENSCCWRTDPGTRCRTVAAPPPGRWTIFSPKDPLTRKDD